MFNLKWALNEWKFERKMRKQRKEQGFSDVDVWSIDYWFADIFVKMIRQLRDNKHGAPDLAFKEVENFPLKWVEEQSNILLEQKRKRNEGKKEEDKIEEEVNLWNEDFIFDRWWMILSRIAWCLEQSNKDSTYIENKYEEKYDEQFWGDEKWEKGKFEDFWNKHFEVSEVDERGKPKLFKLKDREIDKDLEKSYWEEEKKIANYREQCKNEAFDLIKKYFYNLWD